MKKSKLHIYLEQIGVLDTKVIEAIQAEKDKYWREYRRIWAAKKREQCHPFTVLFSKNELQLIDARAKAYSLSRTQTIKQASIAYLSNTQMKNQIHINEIKQLLTKNYCALAAFGEEDDTGGQTIDMILSKFVELEKQILHYVQSDTL